MEQEIWTIEIWMRESEIFNRETVCGRAAPVA